MNEKQFELLMAKLEEIRCCIIDVEEETKKMNIKIHDSRKEDGS